MNVANIIKNNIFGLSQKINDRGSKAMSAKDIT